MNVLFLHVHSRVAVRTHRSGTLEAEWQCRPHCHMALSVGSRYARGRVAVRIRRSGTPEAEWQCGSHCHSVVNVPPPHVHSRVAVRTRRFGTLEAEWQCEPTALVRSGPSGSANPPFWYAQGRVAVPVILPLGGERTSSSRSQSSGSATCGIRETDAARTALAQGVACSHRGCATRGPIVKIGRTQHPDSTCLHRDR